MRVVGSGLLATSVSRRVRRGWKAVVRQRWYVVQGEVCGIFVLCCAMLC